MEKEQIIKANEPQYKLRKQDGYSILQSKNVITGEYTDTKVTLFNSDITLQTRVEAALNDISIKAKDVKPLNKDDINKALEEIESTIKITDEQKELLNRMVFIQADLHNVESVSRLAVEQFDSIFGAGSMDSIIEATYGRAFLPPITTTLSVMTFLGSISTVITSQEVADKINKIKERIS